MTKRETIHDKIHGFYKVICSLSDRRFLLLLLVVYNYGTLHSPTTTIFLFISSHFPLSK